MSFQDWYDAQDPIVVAVKRKFDERSARGLEKYGKNLADNPLELIEWINHLQEELMDGILYCERIKRELNA